MKLKTLAVGALFVVAACSSDDDSSNNANNENNANNVNNVNNSNNANNVNNVNNANNSNNANNVNNVNNSNNVNNVADMGGEDAAQDMGPPPNPLDGIGQVAELATGFSFTEGPKWYPDEGVLRFTDIPQSTIHEWDGNAISDFTTTSQAANGLAFDANGNVLACEHGGRAVSRYVNGTREDFITDFNGDAFNSPNDLVVAADGTVYFTDPPYGLGNRPREIQFNGLFRRAPDGTVTAEWEGAQSTRPNGVNLSPDGSVLYLADTAGGRVYQHAVNADGSLGPQNDFALVDNADGMAVDIWGNVYVTGSGPDALHVFAPDGTKWGEINFPQRPANVAFGGANGQTLFVTARSALYSVDLEVRGIY